MKHILLILVFVITAVVPGNGKTQEPPYDYFDDNGERKFDAIVNPAIIINGVDTPLRQNLPTENWIPYPEVTDVDIQFPSGIEDPVIEVPSPKVPYPGIEYPEDHEPWSGVGRKVWLDFFLSPYEDGNTSMV